MKIRAGGIVFLVALLAAGAAPRALAYESETHRRLAQKTVEIFNHYYSELAINRSLAERFIAGAVDEDKFGRVVYHFYDPVYNRGLTAGGKHWLNAKEWAVNTQAQRANYPSSIFARVFAGEDDVDFSWQRAVADYRSGRTERAFYALGHIVHLIQDISVPAHTRNDEHFLGDAYEKFAAEQAVGDLAVGSPIIKNSLADYFDNLANYSNRNFYSPDSIGLADYSSPQPDYQIFVNGYYYGIKNGGGSWYYLSRKRGRSPIFAAASDITVDDPLVLKDYWRRLAPRAVSYSAGLIYFFLKEVGGAAASSESAYRSRAALAQITSLERKFNLLLGQVGSLIKTTQLTVAQLSQALKSAELELANKTGKSDRQAATITPLAAPAPAAASAPAFSSGDNLPNRTAGGAIALLAGGGSAGEAASSGSGGEETAAGAGADIEAPPADEFSVIISEFLFDAEGSDKGEEYIRLCNLGDKPVDLSGWSVQTGDLAALKKKNFEEGSSIAPHSPFLVWLGDNPAADMLWKSGSLKNSASGVYLVRGQSLITGEDDPLIADSVHYNVDQMPDFAPGRAVIINDCGGAVTPAPPSNKTAETDAADPSLVFYKNPSGDGSLIDMDIGKYQPLASAAGPWQIIVFYKDIEAVEPPQFIETSDSWTPAEKERILTISYPNYAATTPRQSLIIPRAAEHSGNGGGIMNLAYRFDYLAEDGKIRLQTTEKADFLIVAVYDFEKSGGGRQIFKLAAVDPQTYHRREEPPPFLPPAINGSLKTEWEKRSSRLKLSWPRAVDPDSRDGLLSYELTVNGSLRQLSPNTIDYRLVVNPGDRVTAVVRAKDEFGNLSEERSLEWTYPQTELVWSQTEAGGWSDFIGRRGPNCPDCPLSVSRQEIVPEKSLAFDLATVRLDMSRNTYAAKLTLTVKNGETILASETTSFLTKLDAAADFTFIFDESVVLEGGKEYQFILSASGYQSAKGSYQSAIRNAVNPKGVWYLKLSKK